MLEIVPLEEWAEPWMVAEWEERRRAVAPEEREAWIVHHTAGGVKRDPLAYALDVAADHWHQWKRPGGYQYLVGTDAVAREMCGLEYWGVHSGTHYWNEHGLGLAFQGNFNDEPPSDAMLATGVELMEQLWLPQSYHRKVRPTYTDCPGDALIALLPLEDDMPTLDEIRGLLREELSIVDKTDHRGEMYRHSWLVGNSTWRSEVGRGDNREYLSSVLVQARNYSKADFLNGDAELDRAELVAAMVDAIEEADIEAAVADEIDRRARERLGPV